ncbi:hypothetical protein [Kitasatospora sp. NPDC127035]|uniref:hypothetical protein n=1 Tax=Kitasatospora sp. NPDC127035 TaxID=3347111 RepID=UPI00365D6209
MPAPTKETAVRGTARKTAGKQAAVKTVAVGTTADADPAPVAEPKTASALAGASGRRRRTDADSVLVVIAGAGESLRARQVTGLLGLDGSDADVNAVRTMLERLTRNGAVQRTGRGLYAAVSD